VSGGQYQRVPVGYAVFPLQVHRKNDRIVLHGHDQHGPEEERRWRKTRSPKSLSCVMSTRPCSAAAPRSESSGCPGAVSAAWLTSCPRPRRAATISVSTFSSGAGTYGTLLGVMAGGEIVGAIFAGMRLLRMSLGVRIAVFQAVSGLGCAILLFGAHMVPAVPGVIVVGLFSAPLTVWAQSLRMREIPSEQHGRAFALLRTVMQGATPLGGAAAGLLSPGFGIPGWSCFPQS